MKQIAVKSRTGMFTKFCPTRVVKVSELTHGNLSKVLDSVRYDAHYAMQALAVVEESTDSDGLKLRQKKVMKAVILSDALYQQLLYKIPEKILYIKELEILEDFFLVGDRIAHCLNKILPEQNLISNPYYIEEGGIVKIGVPFDSPTLQIVPPITPIAIKENEGILEFPMAHQGEHIKITLVTQAINPVIKIKRKIYVKSMTEKIEGYCYIISPIVANYLNVDTPNI